MSSGPRPVIGVTCYVEDAAWGAWHTTAALLPYSYVRQLTAAGARAVLLPYTGGSRRARPEPGGGGGEHAADPPDADLLGRLGLSERLHHKPSKLSGGEQQRVAVARALANRPLLVLADEPTGNLDEATADRVFDQFVKLVRDHGSAALVATHNERLAARMDRVLRLHEGHIEA